MEISVYSVAMAFICGSVLILLLHILRKKYVYRRKLSFRYITLLYYLCGLRILLPVSFSFTRELDFKGLYADIFDVICWRHFSAGGVELSVFSCFLIVWGVGAICFTANFCGKYYHFIKALRQLPQCEEQETADVLARVLWVLGTPMDIQLKKSENVPLPVTIGLKDKTIILPQRNYSEEELYYILLHECTHLKNGDLWLKMLAQSFCCLLWWNPISYFLRSEVSQTLEIRCDSCVTETMSETETAKYLKTIVSTLKAAHQKELPFPAVVSAAMAENSDEEIVERFQIVVNSKKNTPQNPMVVMAVMGLLVAGSYLVVPRGIYEPDISEILTEPGSIEVTPDNTYLLLELDGNYYPVVNGMKIDPISEQGAQQMAEDHFKIIRTF